MVKINSSEYGQALDFCLVRLHFNFSHLKSFEQMIETSCKNAPTCDWLSTFETNPQLHPGSVRLCSERRFSSSCGLLFPSHLRWILIRSWEDNCDSHHWNKVTELNFTRLYLCLVLVPWEDPFQPAPKVLRGLSGRWLHQQIAAGKDIQSARKKMSFLLLEMHQLPALCCDIVVLGKLLPSVNSCRCTTASMPLLSTVN